MVQKTQPRPRGRPRAYDRQQALAAVIIPADRGFGRAAWAAVCQELKFRSVVRMKPDVTISCPR